MQSRDSLLVALSLCFRNTVTCIILTQVAAVRALIALAMSTRCVHLDVSQVWRDIVYDARTSEHQADIRRLMASTGGEVLEVSEKLTSTSHRMLRIVAAGSVAGVPIRWVHYHLSNDQGRRLAMAFTFDEDSLEGFGDQDMQIVNSLELMAWPSKLDPNALEESTVVAEPKKSASTGSTSATKK